MTKRKIPSIPKPSATVSPADQLLGNVRQMIEAARVRVVETANSVLTMLHWRVGMRIRREVLKEARAEYGEEILPTLSAELMPRYGWGFSTKSLARMVQFAEVFPEEDIVATLSRQLSWSHFVPFADPSQFCMDCTRFILTRSASEGAGGVPQVTCGSPRWRFGLVWVQTERTGLVRRGAPRDPY